MGPFRTVSIEVSERPLFAACVRRTYTPPKSDDARDDFVERLTDDDLVPSEQRHDGVRSHVDPRNEIGIDGDNGAVQARESDQLENLGRPIAKVRPTAVDAMEPMLTALEDRPAEVPCDGRRSRVRSAITDKAEERAPDASYIAPRKQTCGTDATDREHAGSVPVASLSAPPAAAWHLRTGL
jgi:hypothetical protein